MTFASITMDAPMFYFLLWQFQKIQNIFGATFFGIILLKKNRKITRDLYSRIYETHGNEINDTSKSYDALNDECQQTFSLKEEVTDTHFKFIYLLYFAH